jgi:hypothetical protein
MQPTFLEQLFGLLFMGVLVYFTYRRYKNNPEFFSFKAMSKATWTMGILALTLLGFVYLLIQMVGPGDSYRRPVENETAVSSVYRENDRRSI